MVWLPLGPEPRPPLRKDVGTKGRRIRLTSNYFPVTVNRSANVQIVHYDVAIMDHGKSEEPRIPKAKRMRIFEAMKEQYPRIFGQHAFAFDMNKNAYCVTNIPQISKGRPFEVTLPATTEGPSSRHIVKLTTVNSSSLQELMTAIRTPAAVFPRTVFQMLEVMFNHRPSIRYVPVGRNSFYSTEGEFGRSVDITGGRMGVVGFFSSLKPAAWKDGSLLLNVDVSHTAFYKEQPVTAFMEEVLRFHHDKFHYTMDMRDQKKLQKEIKGLKVQVTHSHICRTYRVNGVTPQGANRLTFPLTDPQTNATSTCTVEKYFQMQYQKTLKYPSLNCLHVGPQNKNIYIPIEFCKIYKGQKVNKKLKENETRTLIRETAAPPKIRLMNTCKVAAANNFNSDPFIRSLQFSIADKPLQFSGRVLPAPGLKMSDELYPRQGVWDARDRQFYSSAKLESWVLFNYEHRSVRENSLKRFIDILTNIGRERGMTLAAPIVHTIRSPNPEVDIMQVKQRYPTTQLIMVVLPDYLEVYARIKKTGDREAGIVTQCIKAKNVNKADGATLGNLLLKINAKLDGTNNILSDVSKPVVFTTPVMILGADVNHPMAGDTASPSLAAVVASMDRFASKYAVEVRHQKHRTEMIQDMKGMVKNLLISFYRTTKRKPERLVMYRDGVSDSQFLEVLSYELKAIRSACLDLQKDYQPAITFLVVQKRHHTRLYCDERDGVGRSKNVPPGTTADTDITHPSERDFYLCSHQGIQGTSKPSHYHVLWDDSDLSMDNLQQLTYALCHLYSRCTRSVSIPTPAYYAHLAAFRAKVHIVDLCNSETASLASGDMADIPDAVLSRACNVGLNLDTAISNRLYYV